MDKKMQWLINLINKLFKGGGAPELPKNEEFGKPVESPTLEKWQIKCNQFYGEATKELGIKEGVNDKRIREYHNYSNAKGSGSSTAWCSSFVNFITAQCNLKGTEKALARSWLKWGAPLETPYKGCIVVFWRDSLNGTLGHVGFYAGETASSIIVLGGNQGNSVCKKEYPKSRLLGYRKPIA